MGTKALRFGLATFGILMMGASASAAESGDMFLRAVNADNDKTVSMAEVDAYAMKRFDTLNRNQNKDDTLSMSEMGGRMTPAEFKAANTVHRSHYPSLSKTEFKAYVNKLFAEANVTVKSSKTAASGTLSARELTTPAGKKLIHLLE